MDQRTRKELLGESRVSALFSPMLTNRWLWIETIVIPILGMAFCYLASPADPFFVQAEFPWPLFAPVLVALRYGVVAGVAASGILLATWFGLNGIHAPFPKLYFLGGIIMVMICGEYSTIWRTRLRRVGELNTYLTERFTRLVNQLNVLRLSYDQLEQDLISRPSTLRDALLELRALVPRQDVDKTLPVAQEMLVFLAQHCQLESAALYQVADGGYVACAKLGEPPALANDDPLLLYALEKRTLAHVQSEGLSELKPTDHLVIVPVQTSSGQVLGVLVVTRMPFFALNEDSLRVLALLVGVYADSVVVSDDVRRIVAEVQDCRYEFAEELAKLMRLQRDYRINSHIVIMRFGEHPERLDMLMFSSRLRRRFDVQWQFGGIGGSGNGIANLMPLASELAVRGYLERMEGAVKERFGRNFAELHVRTYVISLRQDAPVDALARMVGDEAQ